MPDIAFNAPSVMSILSLSGSAASPAATFTVTATLSADGPVNVTVGTPLPKFVQTTPIGEDDGHASV